jgi:hypothetical protein
MGGMMKGNHGEWEEYTDRTMETLRTICLNVRVTS